MTRSDQFRVIAIAFPDATSIAFNDDAETIIVQSASATHVAALASDDDDYFHFRDVVTDAETLVPYPA